MKKITAFFLILVMMSLSIISYSASPQISVYVLGGKLDFKDAAPFIENGRTLVPFRAIAEALGANVEWDSATKTVTITKQYAANASESVTDTTYNGNSASDETKIVKIVIGSNKALINEIETTLDVPAKISNSRTYVPLRFVSEALEMGVNWDSATKKIVIDKGNITIAFDKNKAEVGDIVKANVEVNNIPGFTGFQVNIKYDPDVLQPIDPTTNKPYTTTTLPEDGTILLNEKFSPVKMPAGNDLDKGIINYGMTYMNMASYKNSMKAESTGTIGVISFKVLKKQQTNLKFEDAKTMTKSKDGTMLYNWDGQALSNYNVVEPQPLN
ncbi:MAG: stalk domain-containing protein [Bacillota bacterium]|nr:stalk domain-containing protein [Bacillota bacterium]